MKVLHLPTSVGGNSFGLSRGERSIGIHSDVLVTEKNWLAYESDICLDLDEKRIYQKLNDLYRSFVSIRSQYDVYHFNYGSSLFDFQKLGLFLLDLPYYSSSAKKIFTYNGSDARAVHPLQYWPELGCYKPTAYQKIAIALKKIKIKRASKYADHMFALNPDLLRYLPDGATFLPYSIASWDSIEQVTYNTMLPKKIKIVHSPTNRDFKGSCFIIDALESLAKKYPNIEYEIIEKLPHHIAIEKYKTADLIIDQVLIGWYGAFGVEAMKMGIPLAVNIRLSDLCNIPQDMAKDLTESIINISPFNIEEKLAELLESPEILMRKRAAALEYVHKWHNPEYVAQLALSYYEK